MLPKFDFVVAFFGQNLLFEISRFLCWISSCDVRKLRS